MKKGEAVFNSDSGNEAVHGLPDGFPVLPASPIDLSGSDVGVGVFEQKDRERKQVPFGSLGFGVGFDPLQDFGEMDGGQTDIFFLFNQLVKPSSKNGIGSIKEVDPDRAVDQDHARLFLISPRFPAQ